MNSTVRAAGNVLGLGVLLAMLGIAIISPFAAYHAKALPLVQRSISVADVTPGATTQHSFTFSFPSSSNVGSIFFEYCTSPLPEIICSTPPGMNAANAVLANQSGETGFVLAATQSNSVTLTRAPQAAIQNPSQYTFSNIINPSATASFYVRISTYVSIDASGVATDTGSVVAATSNGILINSKVPPYLKFCVALVLTIDCESTNDDNLIDLGDLTTSRVASGSSQMIAATNADFGLAIAVYGSTMTSGNNIISALGAPTVSAPGNAQFGINLRNNTDPDIGEEPSGGGVAVPAGAYNIPNRYMFTSGDVVATSPAVTDTRKFTTSYIVNISTDQPPGVYTATLTYICTATF